MYRKLGVYALVLALVGCSSTSNNNNSRYSIKQDRAPDRSIDVSKVKDAVPRVEPKSRGGNKSPYTVLGKRYYVMNSALGYKETGTASWYGKKFHGHKTSNGEVYNMFAMSAAHKSLPLPTYLRVTNVANNKQVIVRVNDRGPFHGNRLIDLSYAAAARLGMLTKGTARVRLEAIDPRAWQSAGNAISAGRSAPVVTGRYLQVGAYANYDSADYVAGQLRPLLRDLPVLIRNSKAPSGRTLYRVQIGPLKAHTSLPDLTQQVEQMGYSDPRLVDYP